MDIFNIYLEFYHSFQSVLFSGTIIFPEKITRCFDQIRRLTRTTNIPSTAERRLTKNDGGENRETAYCYNIY